jgi:hypothetical protein
MRPWWQTFFDEEYLRLWEGARVARSADAEVEASWGVLGLSSGAAASSPATDCATDAMISAFPSTKRISTSR